LFLFNGKPIADPPIAMIVTDVSGKEHFFPLTEGRGAWLTLGEPVVEVVTFDAPVKNSAGYGPTPKMFRFVGFIPWERVAQVQLAYPDPKDVDPAVWAVKSTPAPDEPTGLTSN